MNKTSNKIKYLILIFSILILLSCDSNDDEQNNIADNNCGENSGCPPPQLNQDLLFFQLINTSGKTIDFDENNIKKISWRIQNSDIQQKLSFDIDKNIGEVFLKEQSFKLVQNESYVIVSPFGKSKVIQISLNTKALFKDECNPCLQYFISSINQNENIFSGELTANDIIKIMIE